MNYLRVGLAHPIVDCVRILHLNGRIMLIVDELVNHDTIDRP